MKSKNGRGEGQNPPFSTLTALQLVNDLSVILTTIVSCIDAIRARIPPGFDIDQDLNAIDHAIDSAFHICRELGTLGAPKKADPPIIDVNDAIIRTRSLVERLLGKRIRLSLSLSETPPLVRADEVQLEWVLLNLAANSRDAMSGGGALTIRTTVVEAWSDTTSRRTVKRSRDVRLSVIDTGHRSRPEVWNRAFEPFFSTKKEAAGLGLTSVAVTVWSLGGMLSVQNHEPSGTQIDIYLPLVESSTPRTG